MYTCLIGESTLHSSHSKVHSSLATISTISASILLFGFSLLCLHLIESLKFSKLLAIWFLHGLAIGFVYVALYLPMMNPSLAEINTAYNQVFSQLFKNSTFAQMSLRQISDESLYCQNDPEMNYEETSMRCNSFFTLCKHKFFKIHGKLYDNIDQLIERSLGKIRIFYGGESFIGEKIQFVEELSRIDFTTIFDTNALSEFMTKIDMMVDFFVENEDMKNSISVNHSALINQLQDYSEAINAYIDDVHDLYQINLISTNLWSTMDNNTRVFIDYLLSEFKQYLLRETSEIEKNVEKFIHTDYMDCNEIFKMLILLSQCLAFIIKIVNQLAALAAICVISALALQAAIIFIF